MEIFKDGVGIIITGTVYNDSIYSTSSKNSNNNVDGLSGNDYISYFGTYSTISGGAGRDHIYASRTASNNEIHGGIDRDTVLAGGNYTKIYGESGDDSLLSTGDNSTIDGGDDNDEILNRGANVEIYGSTGDDSINNSGSHVTIDSSAFVTLVNGSEMTVEGGFEEGFDTVENSGHDVKISTGAGKDSIINIGSDATIIAEDGSKTFTKNSEATIEAGEGNDTIWNKSTADSVSIDAGAGEDYVYNVESSAVSIDGDIDNDRIFNGYYDKENDKSLKGGSNVSINGGAGDDYIENNGGTFDGRTGGGNNTTILGGYDKDTIKNNCSGVTIDGGNGDDSITNERVEYYYAGQPMYRGDEVSINGGDDNNIIGNGLYTGEIGLDFYTNAREFQVDKDYAGGNKVTIETGKGDDSIFNRGDEASINAGKGNNTIINGTFFGGNDRISALDPMLFRILDSIDGGDYVTIEAGENDDVIQSFNSSNVKINTGNGKNLVSLCGTNNNVVVTLGSGEDSVIAGYLPKNFGEVDIITGEVPSDDRYGGSNLKIDAVSGHNLISLSSGWNGVEVNGGGSEGVDVIFNEANGAILNGNGGNDFIRNKAAYAIITGGMDGDIIENRADNTYIHGDIIENRADNTYIHSDNINSTQGGNDYIYTDQGSDVTIDGGAGHDLIEAWQDVRASISGGAGNDRIHLYRVTPQDTTNILWKASKIPLNFIFGKFAEVYNKTTKNFSTLMNIASFGTSVWNSWYTRENIWSFIKGGTIAAIDLAVPLSSVLEIKSYMDDLYYSLSTVNGGAGDDTIVLDGVAPRVVEY